MNLVRLHKWSYVIMGVLTLVMIAVVIAASVSGTNTLLTNGPTVFIIFGVYFVIQIACLLLMRPSLSIYKAGFYILHTGVLLMLIGLFLFEVFGETLSANVPENSAGAVYTRLQREDGSFADFGFGIRLNNFTVENYESGSPKYYGAYLGVYETSDAGNGDMYNSENIMLEMNKTYRKNGWKVYLMSYNDGSGALPRGNGEYAEYSSMGGAAAVASIIEDAYPDFTVCYYVYNMASQAYMPISVDSASLSAFPGKCVARVYAEENGEYSAYISQVYVNLLFKKDPGEYTVLTGMAFVIAGVILMCIIRGKKPVKYDDADDADDADNADEAKNGVKKANGKSQKSAKGSKKR